MDVKQITFRSPGGKEVTLTEQNAAIIGGILGLRNGIKGAITWALMGAGAVALLSRWSETGSPIPEVPMPDESTMNLPFPGSPRDDGRIAM